MIGNISKKRVPNSALSEEDLIFIAQHVDVPEKEEFEGLKERVEQNENDIKELQENGSSGGSELFVIQWNGTTGDKTYEEVSQAIADHKIPVLYDKQENLLGVLNGNNKINGFIFDNTDYNDGSQPASINIYYCYTDSSWSHRSNTAVTESYLDNLLDVTISADNETFKTAVLNCFPDADTMSFPLEEAVSEVSAE